MSQTNVTGRQIALGVNGINLATEVNGTLPVSSGGTGSTTQNFIDLTTAQTIAGVKTFSSAPVVPSNSFPESAVTNLVTDLASKQPTITLTTTGTTGAATLAGATLNIPNYATGGGTYTAGTGLTLAANAFSLTTPVSLGNGGTGSATQNFVDLTTAQTVAGVKDFTSNLGLGTTTPNSKLHIVDNNSLNVPQADVILARYFGSPTNTRASSIFHYYDGTHDMFVVGVSGANGAASSNSPNTFAQARLIITEVGNVGIGGINPTYGLHQLGGGQRLQAVATPTAPTLSTTGTAGTTSYSYYLVAIDGNGNKTLPSPIATITTGNATLSATNYINIGWTAVTGATHYDILKGTTGTSLATAIAGNAVTDTGQATAAYTAPTVNGTANTIVDGTATATSLVGTNLQVTGGTPAVGKVLTSDASGNGTWQTTIAGTTEDTQGYTYITNRQNLRGTLTPASGTMTLYGFTASVSRTITKLGVSLGGTAAAGVTHFQMGLYAVTTTTGALTLVAKTTDQITGLTAAYNPYQVALATSYAITAGTRYMVAVTISATTMPVLNAAAGSDDYGNNNYVANVQQRLVGTVAAQATLPATLADASISTLNNAAHILLVM